MRSIKNKIPMKHRIKISRTNLMLVLAVATSTLLFLVITNYSTVDSSNTTPFLYDEKETLFFAEHFLTTGQLKASNEIIDLNDKFEFPVMTPSYSIWNDTTGQAIPRRMIGIYVYLTSAVALLGSNFLVAFSGAHIVSSFAFSKSISKLMSFSTINRNKRNNAFLISYILFLLFFPFVLWSGTWMESIPALMLFNIANYFLISSFQASTLSKSFWTCFFVFIAGFFRYEYFAFGIAYLLTLVLITDKKKIQTLFLCGGVALIAISLILITNYIFFGSPLKSTFTERSMVLALPKKSSLLETRTKLKDASIAVQFLNTYFFNFINPAKLISNVYNFLFRPFGIYILTLFFVLINATKRISRTKKIQLIPILCVYSLWVYYSMQGSFWGRTNPSWLVNTYYRYSFQLFVIMIGGLAIFFINHLSKKKYKKILILCMTLYIVSNINTLFTSSYDLNTINQERSRDLKLNTELEEITENNALIISPLLEHSITSRQTVSPWYILKQREFISGTILNYTEMLALDGYPLYLVDTPWHANTFLDLYNKFNLDTRFHAYIIDSNDVYRLIKIDYLANMNTSPW